MLTKGTYVPKAPMLLTDFLEAVYLMIMFKDMPSGVFFLSNFLTHFP